MTEQLLHGSQVTGVPVGAGGKPVAQVVRWRATGGLPDVLPDVIRPDVGAAKAARKHKLIGPHLGNLCLQGFMQLGVNVHHAHPPTFTGDPQPRGLHVLNPQRGNLCPPQAGVGGEEQHGPQRHIGPIECAFHCIIGGRLGLAVGHLDR